MWRRDFCRPPTPPVTQHLHYVAVSVDGDTTESLQNGFLTEPELADSLGFRWRVPLS